MTNGVVPILNLSQAAQALALTKENLGLVKNKKGKNLVGTAFKNIVGIQLIKSQGKIIGSL